jgi:hypothetical protein
MPRIIPPRIKTSEFVKTLAWFSKMNKQQQDLVFSKLAGGESLSFAKMCADAMKTELFTKILNEEIQKRKETNLSN